MGQKQLEAFYKRLAEDNELKDKVLNIKISGEAMYAEVAQVAQEAGFEVTPDEVKTFVTSQELSDDALSGVAGGGGGNCATICGTFLGHYVGR